MAATVAYSEISGWNVEELNNELAASKLKLTKLKFNHAILHWKIQTC